MMSRARYWRLATGAALLVSVAGLAGCYGPVYYHDAPPPHAPAYGYRWHQHDYFYYPSVGVYFHIHSGHYYYRDGGKWHRSLRLPPRVVILPRERVHIRIQDKNPWQHHKDHQQRYHPRARQQPLPDRERHSRDRVEREQNERLYREYREGERRRR